MMRVLFFRKVLGKTSIFAIFLILSFIFTNNLFGQSYPLWGELKAGKHQVGFRSVWKFDHSRRYTLKDANNSSKKTIPRPLLINVWYPAKEQSSSKHMKYREYFDILTNDPKLKDLADLYRKHNLSTLAELTLSKSRDQFNEKEEKIFAEFLDSRTASIKDGSALSAKFPVVIYHQGFGASFEDNSVLCEYLASNGFIVIGSSYLKENGTSLGIDGKEGSVRDIAYLLNFANDLPHADTSKVAMVGHSGGAQASVIAKSKTHLAIDAVVSLDTTQDPFSLSDPRWNNFTIPVLKNKEQMKGTLLAFAEYSAYFELYDSLKNMNRIYISMPKVVNHDDYISQGISARRLKNKLKPNADNETKAVEKYYRQICEYIFAFLQRELKSKRQVKNYFKNNFSSDSFRQKNPIITIVEKGKTQPEPFDFDKNLSPLPRQMRGLIDEKGLKSAVSVLNTFKKQKDFNPIYDEIFVFSLISDYLVKNDKKTAIALFNYYERLGVRVKERFLSLSNFLKLFRQEEYAKEILKRLLLLDPKNEKAKEQLLKFSRK